MPKEDTIQSYSAMVLEEWNADSTVDAWRRWYKKTVTHFHPMNQALLDVAAISSGSKVLDLASGAGETAASIAVLVGTDGNVVATDLSEGMLEIAKANCKGCKGIDNIGFQQADAHEMPFADNHFDIVTCRLGIMYFWDCQRALKETLRVLKPGGRAIFVVWGPIEKNGLARTAMSPFIKRKAPPEIPPGAPHPLRFAESGSLSAELTAAGFESILEEQKVIPCPWPGPPKEMWQQIYEMAVPLQPFINSFDDEDRDVAIREAIEEFSNVYDGEFTDPTTCIVVATGMKPTTMS